MGAAAAIRWADGYDRGAHKALGQTAAAPDLHSVGNDTLPPAQLAEIMARVRARDSAAFATLYDATVAKVYTLARKLVRSKADAEDIVCDVYEQAWLQADRFDATRGNVLAWLITICRSRCLDLLRHRQVCFAHAETERADAAEPAGDSQLQLLEQLRDGTAIRAALATLPPIKRQLIGLAFFQDMSHADIAATLAMPLGTVKSHLRRALSDLKAELAARGAHHG